MDNFQIKEMNAVEFLKEYNSVLSLAGISQLTGIHPAQLSHYIQGHRKPSPKTVEKIQIAIHQLARDLERIKLH